MVQINHLDLPACNHGEGLIWMEESKSLVWVDVFEKPQVRIFNFELNQHSRIPVFGPITSVAPNLEGGFVASMCGGFYSLSKKKDPIHLISPESMHPNELLNDGRCDSRGRYLCGSMHLGMTEEIGKIYQLGRDGKIKILDENFIVGNGIAFSPKEDIVYISDSRKDLIWKYNYNIEDGSISDKRVFFSTSQLIGRPDGAAIDFNGNYWSCLFEGGAIICVDSKTGQLLMTIALPVQYPTMCSFGGDKLDCLYVTTSRRLLSELELKEQPLAGKILKISDLGVAGFNSARYAA
jgi:L-arabinonolactonase